MFFVLVSLLLFVITSLINFILIKFNFFIDNKKLLAHKNFTASKLSVPYSGGIILLICLIFLIPYFDYIDKIFFLFIFFLGLFSDNETLNSPIKRFILQFLIVSFFLFFSKIFIISLNLVFFDNLLSIKYISFLFTLLCILILINGSNFLDGVNTLVIGYYLLVIFTLLLLINYLNLNFDTLPLEVIGICLSIIFIFNFLGKLYLGDNGSYLLAFSVGFLLINFINNNLSISPFFIALLLWYPVFENLFSIIRKKINKVPASKPDNLHLHHLLFIFLNKKINKHNVANTTTGILINVYNLIIFSIGFNYYFYTKTLVFLLLINILVYVVLYSILRKDI